VLAELTQRARAEALPSLPMIYQRDDGRYQTDIHDDGPGFESYNFAEAVAAARMPA